jgi:uncharacterized protein YuzE
MNTELSFQYDRASDILYISKRAPYPEQETEELGDEIIARLNPRIGEVENVEVLFFSTRLLRNELFELPVNADLRLMAKGSCSGHHARRGYPDASPRSRSRS